MKRTIPDELKEQNRQLTDECLKIYNDIKFAEIKRHSLSTAVIPFILTFLFVFAVGVLLYYIIKALLTAPDWWCIGFFAFFTLLCMIAVGISWYFVIKNYKYGRSWYFVRDDKNEYQIWCNYDGQKYTVQTIVNLSRHKVLYIDKNGKCSIDSDEDTASKVTGFYQYIVTPDKVYDSSTQSTSMRRNYTLRYKHKKTIGNKTFYYFPSFNNAVFGTRYARCIMLENGMLKYICVENASGHGFDDKTSTYASKYLYSNINNFDFQICIPLYVQEYAQRVKFALPVSKNIIYENSI